MNGFTRLFERGREVEEELTYEGLSFSENADMFVKYWERKTPFLETTRYVETCAESLDICLRETDTANNRRSIVLRDLRPPKSQLRTPTSDIKCLERRHQIGRGLTLSRSGNTVLIHNRSPVNVFYDSTTLTSGAERGARLITHKLSPECTARLFDFDVARRQQWPQDRNNADSVRISFKKGFGVTATNTTYVNPSAYECDCWLEVLFRVHRDDGDSSLIVNSRFTPTNVQNPPLPPPNINNRNSSTASKPNDKNQNKNKTSSSSSLLLLPTPSTTQLRKKSSSDKPTHLSRLRLSFARLGFL